MEIIIKEAKQDEDSLIISELAKEIWSEHYPGMITQNQIEYMLEKFQSKEAINENMQKYGYKYFLAFEKSTGVPVAYCGVVLREKDVLFLSKLYVKREYRVKGIAGKMLDYAIKSYDIKGEIQIYLTVNRNNIITIASYKRLGFDISEEIVTDIGNGFSMDDYKMTKYIVI